MGPVQISLRFKKLSGAVKGKSITSKPEEDEEDFQALIDQLDA